MFISCSSENEIVQGDLQGRWELDSATRNGKDSPALEGVYFDFSKDEFETNFPYPELGSTYGLEDKTIILEGNPPLEMYIKSFENNKLSLDMSLQGSNFTLLLNKNEELTQ